VTYFDRRALETGRVVVVHAGYPHAVAHVACGREARSQWAVIVDTASAREVPDGEVGEIWLHGNNVGRGYWNRPSETAATFNAELRGVLDEGSHAGGAPAGARWLRTGDLGVYRDGQLYVTGRGADVMTIDGRQIYPQHVEGTAADASAMVRRGYAAAFAVPAGDAGQHLVVVAERAAGTARADAAPALRAVRAAIMADYAVPEADVRLVPAGALPRTTSGKLARRACRADYLAGTWGTPGVCAAK
jgi:fatty-acyl-CoA synthase